MRVVQWLLWSPRRAVGAGIALTLVLTVLLMLGAYARDWAEYRQELAAFEAAPDGSAAADEDDGVLDFHLQGPSEGAAAGDPADPEAGDAGLAAGQAEREAASARAEEFVTVWLAGPGYPDQEAWVADLEPLVNGGVLPYLEVTPREELPDVDVADTRSVEVGAFSGTVAFELSNGSVLEVVVVLDAADGDWRVTDYREVAV